MTRQRTVLMTLAFLTLLGAATGRASGLPVHGNLAIATGFATVGVGPFGEFVALDVAGPGFSLAFRACGESGRPLCGHIPEGGPFSETRTVPFNTAFSPTIFSSPFAADDFFDSASATILGVTYRHNGEVPLLDFNRILPETPLTFQAGFLSPPGPGFNMQVSTSLSAPFTFSTDILITDTLRNQATPLLDLHLFGQGIATVNLSGFNNECCATWFITGTTFDFNPSPVPEPATLILFGSTAAGLGLLRCIRRVRQHAA